MASSPSPSDKTDPAPSTDHAAAPDAVTGATRPVEADYQLITDVDGLAAFLAAAKAQGFLAVDTETTGLNAAAADLVGVSMALAPGKACYVPLRHGVVATETGDAQGGLDFSADAPVAYEQIGFETAMAMLRQYLKIRPF
jgi:DNA polymerase-1